MLRWKIWKKGRGLIQETIFFKHEHSAKAYSVICASDHDIANKWVPLISMAFITLIQAKLLCLMEKFGNASATAQYEWWTPRAHSVMVLCKVAVASRHVMMCESNQTYFLDEMVRSKCNPARFKDERSL